MGAKQKEKTRNSLTLQIMSDFWDDEDVPANNNNQNDESSTDDDWDVDSEEERQKKAEKLRKEEEEKQKKKSAQQKIKEREAAEKARREARIAEANRIKTEAEKQALQEQTAEDILSAQIGDIDFAEDEAFERDQLMAEQEKKSGGLPSNIKPEDAIILTTKSADLKTKKDIENYVDQLVKQIFTFEKNKHFNHLCEQVSRRIALKQDCENYESVRAMANMVSTVANQKNSEWKERNKKKKKNSKGVQLGRARANDLDGLGDFDAAGFDDDDFM